MISFQRTSKGGEEEACLFMMIVFMLSGYWLELHICIGHRKEKLELHIFACSLFHNH